MNLLISVSLSWEQSHQGAARIHSDNHPTRTINPTAVISLGQFTLPLQFITAQNPKTASEIATKSVLELHQDFGTVCAQRQLRHSSSTCQITNANKCKIKKLLLEESLWVLRTLPADETPFP